MHSQDRRTSPLPYCSDPEPLRRAWARTTGLWPELRTTSGPPLSGPPKADHDLAA